ncbi:MAG TPA: ISAzo13 family transposase, partial [Solirubrobacteraceae bacterium]
FSFISINWRGKPLTSYQAVINLISATTTSTGLKVYAQLDENEYPTKIKVTNTELATVNMERHKFHGDWNYTVHPSPGALNKS